MLMKLLSGLRAAIAATAILFLLPLAVADDRSAVYGALPNIQMLVMSPDGKTIAYRRLGDGGDQILVYSLAEQRIIGGFLLNEDLNPTSMVFANDDSLVLVVSQHTRVTGFRGKFDVSAAYVYGLKDKKIKSLLAPGGIVYRGQSGLGEIIGISADGEEVYMPAFAGKAELVEDPNYSVFRVKLDSPTRPRPYFSGERRSIDFFVNEDRVVFVHEIFDARRQKHSIEVREGDDWREIYNVDTALREISLVGLTPDYKSLVIAQYDSESDRRSYYTMSLSSGEVTGKLFARDDADVASVITDINRVVYGARYSGFTPRYDFIDPAVAARMDELVKLVDGNAVYLVDWSSDWKTLVVYVEGSGFSGQYFAISEGKEPLMLANARSGFDDATIHPVATFSYAASDGRKIPALLTIPREHLEDISDLPAIMLPHGGPASYDTVGFDWFAQGLADQGYLVIQPQFRGSTGFGLEHFRAGKGEWGLKMQTDLNDGIDALVAKGYIDPARVCIVGLSYGGYAALAGGAFSPERYRCIVSVNGVSDIRSNIQQKERSTADNEWITSYFKDTFGDDDGKIDRAKLDAVSPSNFAENFVAPVLLIHGEDDEVVSISQSKQMNSKLKKAGKDVTFIELDDEGHHLSSNRTRVQTMQEVIRFVNANLN
jgi:dipeptidyl aminopeptidase/acylaminoacyl peptidase